MYHDDELNIFVTVKIKLCVRLQDQMPYPTWHRQDIYRCFGISHRVGCNRVHQMFQVLLTEDAPSVGRIEWTKITLCFPILGHARYLVATAHTEFLPSL